MEAAALIPATSQTNKIPQSFRNELKSLGLEWAKLKEVLPDWADTAFESRSGVLELKTFLARNIGLNVSASGELASKSLPTVRFKTTKGTTHDQVTTARSLVTACARLIAKVTIPQWKGMPADAASFRKTVLEKSSRGWADLPAMLEACWSYGIVVLYLPELPIKGRKMEAMATFVSGHPVVIITKKVQHHPDWMLFLLGHEIGHIAKGHFPMIDGEGIVDDSVDVENTGNDLEEAEANTYSAHVLAPEGRQVYLGSLKVAPHFAQLAYQHALGHGMSPGYVVLNACHNTRAPDGKKPFPLGQAALKHLPNYLGGKSAAEICRTALRANTNVDVLRDDSVEFLEKLGIL